MSYSNIRRRYNGPTTFWQAARLNLWPVMSWLLVGAAIGFIAWSYFDKDGVAAIVNYVISTSR